MTEGRREEGGNEEERKGKRAGHAEVGWTVEARKGGFSVLRQFIAADGGTAGEKLNCVALNQSRSPSSALAAPEIRTASLTKEEGWEGN